MQKMHDRQNYAGTDETYKEALEARNPKELIEKNAKKEAESNVRAKNAAEGGSRDVDLWKSRKQRRDHGPKRQVPRPHLLAP